MNALFRSLLPLAGLAVAGCASLVDTDSRTLRRTGILEYYDLAVQDSLPAAATVGVPFQVKVITYGVGCMSIGGTDVGTVTGGVRVGPYDFLRTGGDEVCPGVVQEFEHRASITPTAAGDLRVLLVGVQEPGRQLMTLERVVEVSAP